jgi:hypothetical protein
VITLKKYVADVTDALGAEWLNGSAEGEHMKGLINRLKDRGIRFVTGRPTSTSRVAANTSRYLAPFFKSCKIYHEFFPRLGYNPASWAVFEEKPIINRAKKITLLGKVCTFPRFITMGKLLAASLSTMDLAHNFDFNFAI